MSQTLAQCIDDFQKSWAHAVSESAGELKEANDIVVVFLEKMKAAQSAAFDEVIAHITRTFDAERERLAKIAGEARNGAIIEGRAVLPQATLSQVSVEAVETVLVSEETDNTADAETARIAALFAPVAREA